MEEQVHKPHRKSKEKKKHTGDQNPKAFAFSKPGKLQRTAARSQDVCFAPHIPFKESSALTLCFID